MWDYKLVAVSSENNCDGANHLSACLDRGIDALETFNNRLYERLGDGAKFSIICTLLTQGALDILQDTDTPLVRPASDTGNLVDLAKAEAMRLKVVFDYSDIDNNLSCKLSPNVAGTSDISDAASACGLTLIPVDLGV